MSKGSFILNGSRGKVGNLVARRQNGKTVLAEYVVPKNPQTQKQMAQRIIFATVGQAAKFMKPIIDHSFEGKAFGQESTNEFRKRNLMLLRQYAAKDFKETPKGVDSNCFMTTKGVSALIPNRYQMSAGSLVVPDKMKSYAKADQVTTLFQGYAGYYVEVIDNKITLGEVLSLIGLSQPGQQITKCFIGMYLNDYMYSFEGSNEAGAQIARTKFSAVRLCLKQTVSMDTVIDCSGDNPLQTIKGEIRAAIDETKSDPAFVDEAVDCFQYNEEEAVKSVSVSAGDATLITGDDALHILGFCTILSQPYNNSWLRSTSFMTLQHKPEPDDFNYGLNWNAAVQAWFSGDVIAENDLFLEQGGTQNEIGY